MSGRGWLRVFNLKQGDTLVASLLILDYGRESSLYNIAFDREFAHYSPGNILFVESIKAAISGGRKFVDFLRGSEKYKYSFGAEDCKIFQLSIKPGDDS